MVKFPARSFDPLIQIKVLCSNSLNIKFLQQNILLIGPANLITDFDIFVSYLIRTTFQHPLSQARFGIHAPLCKKIISDDRYRYC